MGVIQTLATIANTNKLFKTVIIKGLFAQLLALSRAAVPHTGDAAEFILGTINIPANTLTVTGRLKLTMLFRFTGTVGTKTIRVRLTNLAGASLAGAIVSGGTSLSGVLTWQFWNTGALNTNSCMAGGVAAGYGFSTVDILSPNVDTSQAWTLVITAQNASAADTSTLLGYDVEVMDSSV